MQVEEKGKPSCITPISAPTRRPINLIMSPERVHKLLLHKMEIRRLTGKTRERGYTLVPLKMYLKHGKVKIEVGLAKGKTQYDKRENLKKRSADREIEKVMKAVKGRT